MTEITECPSCQRKLQVPEALLGHDVQCPTCGATFTAKLPGPAGSGSARPVPQPTNWEEDRPREAYQRDERRFDDYGRTPLRRDLVPHRGTTVLILGILSLTVCGILAIPALVMANTDLAEMKAGRMDPEGEGMTNGGRICAIISLVLMVVGCGCYGLIIMMAAAGGR